MALIGDKTQLAIEFGITQAYAQLSHRALGFFVVYIRNQQFGIKAPDATLLANSFDEIERRLKNRGKHIASFASDPDAYKIAHAFSEAIYVDSSRNNYFNMTRVAFEDAIWKNHLRWAPDGDEAFDDSSYILQFDIQDKVRLIAFKRPTEFPDPNSLQDLWLSAKEFYSTLQQWLTEFELQWQALPKLSS